MSTVFSRAILRNPGESYAQGITSAGLGSPDLSLARRQHTAYAQALIDCGLDLTVLAADEAHPDGCFVEDTAILTARGAIVTRPGADSRRGETHSVEPSVRGFYDNVLAITAPGTVDGGDICQCEDHFFIGISARTNEAGATQLADLLRDLGYTSSFINIRASTTLLHLKTGISYLGNGRLVVGGDLPVGTDLRGLEPVTVAATEAYAANCVRINDRVLVAEGFPEFTDRLARLGYDPLPLAMSEFRKMDGGLSCLSLRF
jgi:dimethylargininase